MKATTPVRIARGLTFLALAYNLFWAAREAIAGRIVLALICAAMVPGLLGVACFQAWHLHRLSERDHPHPDYAVIARMEREVYGETAAGG